ncbi:MAG: FumA C-terminus/TtdB family hydratase beta subunit [Candidatus Nezhaarchaeales archaeon]
MTEYRLLAPIKGDVRGLRVEDVVYISGIVYTMRDMAHRKLLELAEKNIEPPVQMDGAVIYHAGPIVRRFNEEWEVISLGPTTSSRMSRDVISLLKYYPIRMIVGKGGMDRRVVEALKTRGAVYCHYTGGAAVLAAKCVKRVLKVEWLDLGVPEALWVLEVENFGPLIVTIDANGNSLYEKLKVEVKSRVKELFNVDVYEDSEAS